MNFTCVYLYKYFPDLSLQYRFSFLFPSLSNLTTIIIALLPAPITVHKETKILNKQNESEESSSPPISKMGNVAF